ncbi:MAG TPA: hypothetical protein DCQ14_03860 [Firmicutes bacterium]|nr:hypothetical protein [Bacillota bacterium]
MEERIKVLLAELDAQGREILRLHASIENKVQLLRGVPENEDLTVSLAYKLHNLYSAYENMFKLVAGFFENQIEDFGSYHLSLLKRMLLAIEGIRPAMLTEDTYRILDELRGFRHVFRHAYSYQLDAERIVRLADKSVRLKQIFSGDFEDFTGKLRR